MSTKGVTFLLEQKRHKSVDDLYRLRDFQAALREGGFDMANAVENPSVGSTPLLAQSAAISCESRGLLIQVFVVGSGKGPPRGGPFPRVADCALCR